MECFPVFWSEYSSTVINHRKATNGIFIENKEYDGGMLYAKKKDRAVWVHAEEDSWGFRM